VLEFVQSSLSNIALIFFMLLCAYILMTYRKYLSARLLHAVLLAIASFTVICMYYLPVSFSGFSSDLRLIPLVFLAVYWGWKSAFAVLLITSAWRFFMGGIDAIPEIFFGMVLPVVFALLFRSANRPVTLLFTMLVYTVCWLLSDVPVLFFMPDGWSLFQEMGLIRFASFLVPSLVVYAFVRNHEMEMQHKKELEYHASHDPLTGLLNIRSFLEEVRKYRHSSLVHYIAMIDVDHFKQINDAYGHPTGDAILQNVAQVMVQTLNRHLAGRAVIGRYGGEEFIVFLAAHSQAEMMATVESIRANVEMTPFRTSTDEKIPVTVSIGVSRVWKWIELKETIQQADRSLYTSKNSGRNQIHYAEVL